MTTMCFVERVRSRYRQLFNGRGYFLPRLRAFSPRKQTRRGSGIISCSQPQRHQNASLFSKDTQLTRAWRKEIGWLLRQCTSFFEVLNGRLTAQNLGGMKRQLMLEHFMATESRILKPSIKMNQCIAYGVEDANISKRCPTSLEYRSKCFAVQCPFC